MSNNGNEYRGNGEAAEAGLPDKLPPRNLEAERGVLCGLLLDNEHFDAVLDLISETDFYRDTHQIIFRAMVHVHMRGDPVEIIGLMEELERRDQFKLIGGHDTLLEIANAVPHAANCVFHAGIVRAKSKTRQTIQTATEVIRDGYSNLFTCDQTLERAVNHLSALFEEGELESDDGIRDFPEQPGEAAYHGVMGEIVREIDPHTEANLAAILFQLLVGFGNMVGRGPHWVHESDKHRLNLFVSLVGNTADGRKGTSWGYPRRILTAVDPSWGNRIIPGINSGPGLIEQVADEETTRTGSFLRGVNDKRVLMYESEFTRLLAIFARDSETLGMVLRQAWEDDNLAALSKKNPVRATGAHVSVIAHVTPEDLQVNLSLNDIANGLGNRFLWVCTKASKKLDHEGRLDWRRLDPHIEQLRAALEWARRDLAMDVVPMGRAPTAQRFWVEQLGVLRKPRPGLLGAILARGPAQVMRLAAIYAVVDRQPEIETHHLKAALELWAYCVRSIDFVFGDRLGDKDAEKLLAALEEAGAGGISQKEIQRRVFSNHKDAESLNILLRKMIRSGLIRREQKRSGGPGKPAWIWYVDTPPPPSSANFANLFPENEVTPY
jgi:hypothetical protein